MKTQQETRGASLRVPVGHSTRSTELGGRSTAPGFGVWAPILTKLALAIVAALVLAIIGARAGANASPPAGPEPSPTAFQAVAAMSFDAGGHPAGPRETDTPQLPPSADSLGGGTLPDGRIVLNRAAEDDLTKLPGIGPSRAKAILALRARLGRFRAPQDLLRVKGIGRKTLARLLPLVVVNAPLPAPAGDAGAPFAAKGGPQAREAGRPWASVDDLPR